MRMILPRIRVISMATLSVALLAACDTDDEPAFHEERLEMCRYDDFSADITSGPNQGLHLAGTLFLIREQPDTRIGGHLMTPDNEVIPIHATVSEENDIAITFHTQAGFVMGLGPMTGPLCDADNIEGVAVGPVIGDGVNDGDSGHWLLQAPNPLDELPVIEPFNYPGDLNPQDSGFTTNVTAQQCFKGGGVVELRCKLFCLLTYKACRGGDHKDEVIIE